MRREVRASNDYSNVGSHFSAGCGVLQSIHPQLASHPVLLRGDEGGHGLRVTKGVEPFENSMMDRTFR